MRFVHSPSPEAPPPTHSSFAPALSLAASALDRWRDLSRASTPHLSRCNSATRIAIEYDTLSPRFPDKSAEMSDCEHGISPASCAWVSPVLKRSEIVFWMSIQASITFVFIQVNTNEMAYSITIVLCTHSPNASDGHEQTPASPKINSGRRRAFLNQRLEI